MGKFVKTANAFLPDALPWPAIGGQVHKVTSPQGTMTKIPLTAGCPALSIRVPPGCPGQTWLALSSTGDHATAAITSDITDASWPLDPGVHTFALPVSGFLYIGCDGAGATVDYRVMEIAAG